MAIHNLMIALSLLLLLVTISHANPESDYLIQDLISLRSSSKDSVIRLDDNTVTKYLTSVSIPRPYSLIIFFDAINLHSHPEIRLQEFRREFALVSSTFTTNNNNSTKLFFCEIIAEHTNTSFRLFAVKTLPRIALIDRWLEKLDDESSLMNGDDLSGLAETMAEFVERRTKLTVGPIIRPPLLTKIQIFVVVALFLFSSPVLIYKIIKGETMLHDKRVWLCGAVFVYFFSVAGTMHNIIRQVPMFVRDREDESKLVLFYQGADYQFGAEGFTVGLLYTVVGVLLAFVSNGLVRVESVNEQRMFMVLAFVISSWAVKKVVYLDNWKTDYAIYPYWPSSWR